MAPVATARGAEPQFCDLGPLMVRIDGAERPPGGPRPTAALALLLMNVNRRVGADALRNWCNWPAG